MTSWDEFLGSPQPKGSEMRPFAELAPFRGGLYSCLASVFTRPPEAPDVIHATTELVVHLADLLEGSAAEALHQDAQLMNDNDAWAATARQTFMDLFKVPGQRYVAPYESVYMDSREIDGRSVGGLLVGRSCVDARRWYQLAAADIIPNFKELDDHIGVELGFMSHLCGKETSFFSEGKSALLRRTWEIERDFLASHVVSWAGILRDKVLEKSDHPYFRAMARLSAEFAQRDLEALVSLVGPVQGSPWER